MSDYERHDVMPPEIDYHEKPPKLKPDDITIRLRWNNHEGRWRVLIEVGRRSVCYDDSAWLNETLAGIPAAIKRLRGSDDTEKEPR